MAKEKYLLIAIIALGIILRLITINQSFWLDEAAQANMSARPLMDIWFNRSVDFHPPLFYFLAHFWQLVNRSEVWLRLLPLSFGVINIFVIYYLGKLLIPGRYAGLLSAFLLAVNNFHIYYSQEYRAYSLLCLLGTLSMYFLYRRNYFWLAIVNALLLYTHYSSVFLILTQAIIVIFSFRSQIFSFFLSLAGSLVLFIPWLPQFLQQLNSGVNIDTYLPGWRQVLSISPIKALPLIVFKLVAGRINLQPLLLYYPYIIFVVLTTLVSFIFTSRHKPFLFSWTFIPVFIMLLISVALPQNQPFRVIFILPAIMLIFTQACLRFPKVFITLIIYIAVVGNFTYYTRPRLQREQWRQATAYLTSHPSPVILKFTGNFAPIDWYSPGLNTIPALTSFPASPGSLSPALITAFTQFNHLYLLEYLTGLTDPSRLIDQTLVNNGWQLNQTLNYEGVGFIHAYDRIKL